MLPFADGSGVTDPVDSRMGSECLLRHDDQSAWVQPPSPLGPCPMLWISAEGSGTWAQTPPPRPVSHGPLSALSASCTHFTVRFVVLLSRKSCYIGCKGRRACSVPEARLWGQRRGSQEHRRRQERAVRGPRWHRVTCSPSRDRIPLSSPRAGSSRGPEPVCLSCVSNRLPRPSAFLRPRAHSLVSSRPDA